VRCNFRLTRLRLEASRSLVRILPNPVLEHPDQGDTLTCQRRASKVARCLGDVGVAVVVTTMFGAGVLLALSPQSPPGIETLLFGDILGPTDADLVSAAILAVLVVRQRDQGAMAILLLLLLVAPPGWAMANAWPATFIAVELAWLAWLLLRGREIHRKFPSLPTNKAQGVW